MADVDAAVTEMVHEIMAVGDDTRRFTQAESVDFYEAIAGECNERAHTIASEMYSE